MIGLLIKDWKLLKNQGRYFFSILTIAMVCLIMGSVEYAPFATSYITFLFAYFTLSTISYDEYDNGMGFLLTLPVSRRTYVSEKYLLTVFLTGGAWLLSVGINLIFLFSLDRSGDAFWEMLCMEPVFLPVVLAFLSVSLPLFLKFGPEKGRVVSFGIIGIATLAAFILLKMGIGISKMKVLDSVLLGQPLLILGICILSSALFVGISYVISVKLMMKKEF